VFVYLKLHEIPCVGSLDNLYLCLYMDLKYSVLVCLFVFMYCVCLYLCIDLNL
jgi:hypothetical protein